MCSVMDETYGFKSRRNRVWLKGGKVYKQILPKPGQPGLNDPRRSAAFEADMLKKLHARGVYVPRVFSCENDILEMEYIESATLTDYLEACETGAARIPAEAIAQGMTHWFEIFYAALPEGHIRGDVNCRNFLVTPDGRIAGLDFETARTGDRETDLGGLLAFILEYRPKNTPFKKMLSDLLHEQFVTRFKLDPVLVAAERTREMKAMETRRGQGYRHTIEPKY